MILKKEDLKVGLIYEKQDILQLFPNAIHLKTTADGDWTIDLFYDPDKKIFLARGPFGRWEGVGFELLDIQSADQWDLRRYGHLDNAKVVNVNPMPKSQV